MTPLSTISMIVIESVSAASARPSALARGKPLRRQRDDGERVAEGEREPHGERQRRKRAPAQGGPDHHAQHLADAATREAVQRRTQGQPVEIAIAGVPIEVQASR